MSKQQEIRKWLEGIFEGERLTIPRDMLVGQILSYLDSEDVVIIDRGRRLPERTWYSDWGGESGKAGYELALEDMAGYVAVESLIKEDNNVYHQEKTK